MEELKHLGSCIEEENITEARKLQLTQICGINRNIYGYKNVERKNEYTVLLVGTSKCGKSTLIDFIANFFMGVTSPNEEIFYVTRDNTDKADNTDKGAFCFYTFCTNVSVFNFIDSPSINNESGIR
ncbi:unnamed protein product [Meganyctiphanes norvegica]|uniref:Uncharacterized protein n=1 Tax=Meganyctiphanes norvegica TaxID=48144 RepID=A0AAV2SKT3_MEGNR